MRKLDHVGMNKVPVNSRFFESGPFLASILLNQIRKRPAMAAHDFKDHGVPPEYGGKKRYQADPVNSDSISLLDRLRGDLQLAMITLFGLLGIGAILPFAVYRMFAGHYLIVLVDFLIVAGLTGAALFAWRTDQLDLTGKFLAAFTCVACIVVVYVFGLSPLWCFSTFMATFMVGERRFATAVSLVTLAAVGLHEAAFVSNVERLTFVAVAGMVILFALIFSTRTARQNAQLRDLVLVDPLTGTANRRALKDDLSSAVAGFHKHNSPWAVAVLDLDHFKQVNDRHGHAAGDQVLVDLVNIIQDVIRRGDRLYRYGGEEFVILLADIEGDGLKFATGKVLQAVRQHLKGPDGPVTVSVGAAELQPGECWKDWLIRADHALYRAKNQGRDRIVLA
jgi:diguanylate cyclase